MRKKWIIGIVAGVAVVGGIVTAIVCHKRKRDDPPRTHEKITGKTESFRAFCLL